MNVCIKIGLDTSVKYETNEDANLYRAITFKEMDKIIKDNSIDILLIETNEEIDTSIYSDKVGCVKLVHKGVYGVDGVDVSNELVVNIQDLYEHTNDSKENNTESDIVDFSTFHADTAIANDKTDKSEDSLKDEYNEENISDEQSNLNGFSDGYTQQESTPRNDDNSNKEESSQDTYSDYVDELKEQISRLEIQLAECNEVIENMKADVQSKVTESSVDTLLIISQKDEEIASLKSIINSNNTELNIIKNRNLADISKEDLQIISDRNTWLTQETERLNSEIQRITNENNKVIHELEKDKQQLNEYINKMSQEEDEKNSSLRKKQTEANKVYNSLMVIVERLSEINSRLKVDMSQLTNQYNNVVKQLSDTEISLQLKTEEHEKAINDIDKLNDLVSSIEKKMQLLSEEEAQKRSQVEGELKLRCIDVDSLKLDNERIKLELEKSNEALNKLSDNIKESEMLRNRIANLEESEKELSDKVSELIEDRKNLSDELNDKNGIIGDLRIELGNCQDEISALKNSGGSVNFTRIRSLATRYKGKAKIITVFGNGSYGITTTVLTLLEALRGKKLVLDMDIANPTLDMRFKKPPVIKSLGIPDMIKSTSFGATIEKGSTFAAMNMDRLIIELDGKTGYFSGAYAGFNKSRIMGLNFNEILDAIPDEYDYIVVDCGKINMCAEADSLIKTFSEVAYKNIIVTRCDLCYVRNTKICVDRIGIDISKSIWLLNFAVNYALDTNILKLIKNDKKMLLSIDRQLVGTEKSFMSSQLCKGKMSELLELLG